MQTNVRNYLMFDRKWIENYHGALKAKGECNFKAVSPVKRDAPAVTAEKPWESMSLGWGTMLLEEGKYRLWYEAWDEDYRNDYGGRLCYAESADGTNWVKPNLGLIEYGGNRDNNIVFDGRTAGGMGFHGHGIFMDPASAQNARYRMIYMTAGEKWEEADEKTLYHMGFAYSEDGKAWLPGVPERRSWINKPFAPFGSDTQSVVYWDGGLREYVGYFRIWENGSIRSIGRSATSDFGRWPEPQTILSVDEQDPFGMDFYNSAACKYSSDGDAGHFMFISMFDHEKDTLNVSLATSRDGIRYSRLDRSPFLAGSNSCDNGGIYMCPGIQKAGDSCLMAYHAVSYRHADADPKKIRYQGSLHLLTVPKDRFQGINAEQHFEFNLNSFQSRCDSVEITLNAIVREGGSIVAGMMEKNGGDRYIDGYSPEDCVPVIGDGLNLAMRWKSEEKSRSLKGLDIELRIFMENCVIFSIRVMQPE